MTESRENPVTAAREYYNSEDADNFYYHIWGGEDIHIGMYRSEDEPIRDASRRTVEEMARTLQTLSRGSHVLDIGAGYGGAARYLAKAHGCRVTALNLSERENERNRKMNQEQKLDHLIEVIDGSFEEIPADADSADIVWSQDAILHSGDRARVIAEVARVLKPGGEFIFTDPMQSDDCPEGVLQPILERIHLGSLGSPGFYERACAEHGLERVSFADHTDQLARHYRRVHDEIDVHRSALGGKVSDDYLDRMKKGLRHWVEGGRNGWLRWGIMLYRFKTPRPVG